jgi:hypothetical protein
MNVGDYAVGISGYSTRATLYAIRYIPLCAKFVVARIENYLNAESNVTIGLVVFTSEIALFDASTIQKLMAKLPHYLGVIATCARSSSLDQARSL